MFDGTVQSDLRPPSVRKNQDTIFHAYLQKPTASSNIMVYVFQLGLELLTMELAAIFSKTAKGHEEVSTRQNRLPSRVRAMLIMVDGRRTGSELLTQSVFGAEAEQYLAALLDGEFIAAQSVLSTLSAATPVHSEPTAPAEDISLTKRYALQTLHEFLGPDADRFAPSIEKVQSAQEILQHLEKLREVLIAGVGRKKAEQFWEKISLVLTKDVQSTASGAAPEHSEPAPPAEDISLAKRYALQTLHEFLGPDADSFSPDIEKAQSAQELLRHLEKLRELLIASVGRKKAEQFWEKMSLVLT